MATQSDKHVYKQRGRSTDYIDPDDSVLVESFPMSDDELKSGDESPRKQLYSNFKGRRPSRNSSPRNSPPRTLSDNMHGAQAARCSGVFSDDDTAPIEEEPEHNGSVLNTPLSQKRSLVGRLWQHCRSELLHGYRLDPARDKQNHSRVIRFIIIPKELEIFVAFGFTLCLNCFLEYVTYFPLRFLYAVARLPTAFLLQKRLSEGEIRDLMRFVLISLCCMVLHTIDISYIYHLIRAELQSIVKLYVLFNVFDIIDRLFCSFGQDLLDGLFWQAANHTRGVWLGYFGLYFIMAFSYVVLHAVVMLMQFVILNVAINSANHALLTIVISNQFVELKGSVFKRSGPGNLFQICCSDVRERFHFFCLLLLVFVRNMNAFNWSWTYFVDKLGPAMALVYGSEMLVDWIKHIFVTRFNNIDSEVYKQFSAVLYDDMKRPGPHSLRVVRRMGFTPIPLLCVIIHSVWHVLPVWHDAGTCYVTAFAVLLLGKFTLSFLLRGELLDESKSATTIGGGQSGPPDTTHASHHGNASAWGSGTSIEVDRITSVTSSIGDALREAADTAEDRPPDVSSRRRRRVRGAASQMLTQSAVRAVSNPTAEITPRRTLRRRGGRGDAMEGHRPPDSPAYSHGGHADAVEGMSLAQSNEFALRYPMEKAMDVIDGGGENKFKKKEVPLEEVNRFTMMSRIS